MEYSLIIKWTWGNHLIIIQSISTNKWGRKNWALLETIKSENIGKRGIFAFSIKPIVKAI